MRLDGRVAVVTGAGGGIGAAIARALAKEGCRVALVDVAEGPLRAAAAGIPGSTAHVADVSKPAAMEALAKEVVAAHGAVHVLVNNAGITIVGGFLDHSEADWDRVLGVNLMGVVNGCRAFLPHLAKADEAWIVNVSSLFGLMGIPGQSAYCASKFAVRGFSEALAGELAGTHIGVTTVHPGGVKTGIMANAKAGEGMRDGAKLLDKLDRFFHKNAVPPETAAEAIVGAVKAGRTRLRVCRETYLLDWMVRLAPVWGHRTAVNAIKRAMGVEKDLAERQARAISAK